MEKHLIKNITRILATTSQLILASPVRLPAKVVAIAKYVSLGMALLEAIGRDDEAHVAENGSPCSGAGDVSDSQEHDHGG